MLAIFLKTLPFFFLISVGYLAARTRFFAEEATGYLTKFVFYFALSAMLFRFAANLAFDDIWNPDLAAAYLLSTAAVYLLATLVGALRGLDMATNAVEAQCCVIGNVGFLGIPVMTLLLGPQAIAPLMLILAIDLIVFSSLIVILITISRDGRMSLKVFAAIGLGLLKNPMVLAISLGLLCSAVSLPMPTPVDEFLQVLGAAATPCALFVIGASLASKSAERLVIAGWISFCKLFLHPVAVAVAVLMIFPVEPYPAGVAIALAAMPVAGNVFILAQHYGIAPQRVSAAILVSTVVSVLTLSGAIAWVQTFGA